MCGNRINCNSYSYPYVFHRSRPDSAPRPRFPPPPPPNGPDGGESTSSDLDIENILPASAMTANYVREQAMIKGGAKAKRTPSKPPRKPRLEAGQIDRGEDNINAGKYCR